ncbi:MAG TPA: Na+-dependent transporter [Pseudolabrys sp.]|nr:Na+-dependent transporter [Pseudolabrys sp.]
MNILKLPAAVLAGIGRHGTLVVAASIFVGLLVPGLAAIFRPVLGEAIIVMLTLAFLRVDPAELRHHVTRPGLIAAATVWVMLVLPLALCMLFVALGLDQRMPSLYFMLVLQMSAPGLMSSPALAALMGLDVALTLASLVVSVAITPLVAGGFAHVFLGRALVSPVGFGVKLFFIIAGSALAATVVRRIAGRSWVEAHRQHMDGLSVLAMFMFAVAAMDGVTDHFRADPLLVVELTLLTFALWLGSTALTALVFLRAGRARALAIGLIAGNRNMGLMLTAMAFQVPDIAWLYFGLAQFPIYLLPHLLKPLARRLQQTGKV